MSRKPHTYAEVNRRVSRMRAEGMPEARIREKRRIMWDDVTEQYKRKAANEKTIIVPAPERLDHIRDDVAKMYEIDAKQLYDKNRGNGYPGRKHAITRARRAFIVAARAIGYSTTELAMYLRRPGAHSSIIYMEQQADDEERAVGEAALAMDARRRESARQARIAADYENVRSA